LNPFKFSLLYFKNDFYKNSIILNIGNFAEGLEIKYEKTIISFKSGANKIEFSKGTTSSSYVCHKKGKYGKIHFSLCL